MSGEQAGVQHWALNLHFIRTRAGEEFNAARRLQKTILPSQEPNYQFFTTFGHYDLIGLQVSPDIDHVSPAIIDPAVEEICSYRFFPAFGGEPERLAGELKGHPLNAAIFVKIEPRLSCTRGATPEWELIAQARKLMSGDGYFFNGLGHAEILILCLGCSVEEIFAFTSLLGSLPAQCVGEAQPPVLPQHNGPSGSGEENLIAKTFTFFLCNHPGLNDAKLMSGGGRCRPLISVSCCPGFEAQIDELSELFSPAKSRKEISLGFNDVQLRWDEDLEFTEFAGKLTTFREAIREKPGIYNVSRMALT